MLVPDALTDGPRFAAFSERYVVHTKGRWARQPVILEPWQREFWWEALEIDPATGLRVYTEVGLGIPRKNGKSVMASDAGHYFLVADGEDEPDIIVAAAAKGQAGIVLDQARRMALQSPRLLRLVTVQKHLIECPRNGGKMRSVSADAGLQHGLNPHASIIDELHAHKNGDLYTALQTGTGAREQPILHWISTAGSGDGILREIYDSMFTGEGELEVRTDPFYLTIYRDRAAGKLIYWYGAPDDADIHDPEVWRRSNPASWLQDGRVLRRAYLSLKARGALSDFRMYHLNQWVDHSEPWMDPDLWASAAGDVVLDPALRTYVAIRIAHDHRAAAVAVAQRQGDRVAVRVRSFLQPPDGDYLSASVLEAHLLGLRRRYPAPVLAVRTYRAGGPEYIRNQPGPEVMYSGAFFEGSKQKLEKAGVVMSDVPSTPERVTPAAETLMRKLTEGLLVHDGDPELARQMANVVAKPAAKGWSVAAADASRPGEQRRIVAATAAMLAVHRADTAPTPQRNVTRRHA